MSSAIRTASGKLFDIFSPDANMINIHDIATGLSREPRYAGQTIKPYYVAQHCVLLTYLCPEHLCWEALHHEDPEVFLKDIPSPIKKNLPEYKNQEEKTQQFFYSKYKVNSNYNEFHYYDKFIRKIEVANFFDTSVVEPTFKIHPMTSEEAYDAFIRRYIELKWNIKGLFHENIKNIVALNDTNFVIYPKEPCSFPVPCNLSDFVAGLPLLKSIIGEN